jgi:hypothetical protein
MIIVSYKTKIFLIIEKKEFLCETLIIGRHCLSPSSYILFSRSGLQGFPFQTSAAFPPGTDQIPPGDVDFITAAAFAVPQITHIGIGTAIHDRQSGVGPPGQVLSGRPAAPALPRFTAAAGDRSPDQIPGIGVDFITTVALAKP